MDQRWRKYGSSLRHAREHALHAPDIKSKILIWEVDRKNVVANKSRIVNVEPPQKRGCKQISYRKC